MSEPAEDSAALRARVYAPGATGEDVARYRASLGAAEPVAADGGDSAPDPPPAGGRAPGRRPSLAVLLGGGLVVLAGVLGTTLLGLPHATRPAARPSVPLPHAVALDVPAVARAGFARALAAGDGADLSDYLLYHPAARPAELTTLSRAASEEHHGVGGATVTLAPSTEADRGGRLTVILTLDRDTEGTWRAARLPGAGVQQLGVQTVRQHAGTPVSTTIGYTGRAATLLSVSVPRGTRWDALVVFSN